MSEVRSAFAAAHIVGYITAEQQEWAHSTDAEAQRSLNGYITFIRNQHLGREEFGDKALHDGVVPYYVTMPDSPFPDFQSPPLITDHRSPITDP